jgi:superfamily II DNA or RNA helicase
VKCTQFIARRYPGFFKLLVADEVHQMKGQSTDQGYALGALVRACSKTLALTGTIYGGRATSLFFLLHRLLPRVRAEFKWSDGQKWAERYGILERVTRRTEGDSGYGTFSGKRRRQTYVRELPGASPELAALLLDGSAFVNLSDLGFQLPGYHEFPHTIPMAQDQRAAYDALEDRLIEELKARIAAGDRSLLAAYLQSLLAYPNSCFRKNGRLGTRADARRLAQHETPNPGNFAGVSGLSAHDRHSRR